jgi:hypothetical protein
MILMPTNQTQLLNEIGAGHDGPQIPPAKLAYFQERFRDRVFEFIVGLFLAEQQRGLTKAKLGRRIGKKAEVINRWLGAPSNLTLDTVSDLLIGIAAQELTLGSVSLLGRAPVNYDHLDDAPPMEQASDESARQKTDEASALKKSMHPPQQEESGARAAA